MARFKRYFQDGGAASGTDPVEQIVMMAAQAVQNQDGDLALQACQALVELAQGGASQQEAGAGYTEENAEEEPVYGKGGRLVGRFRRTR